MTLSNMFPQSHRAGENEEDKNGEPGNYPKAGDNKDPRQKSDGQTRWQGQFPAQRKAAVTQYQPGAEPSRQVYMPSTPNN